MTDPKEMAQAILDASMSSRGGKFRVIATLRELNKQFDDWGGDEPSCCVFRELVDIIEELEKL